MQAKKYTLALTAAGSAELLVEGAFFKIISCTGIVRVTGSPNIALDNLTIGQGMKDTPFKRLLFTDQSGGANTIIVLVADREFIDGITGSIAVTSSVVPRSALFSQINRTVAAASALMVLSNLSRQYLAIINRDPVVTIYVNIAGSIATVLNGIPIGPGQSLELNTVVPTGEIYFIGSAAGTANSILVVEG